MSGRPIEDRAGVVHYACPACAVIARGCLRPDLRRLLERVVVFELSGDLHLTRDVETPRGRWDARDSIITSAGVEERKEGGLEWHVRLRHESGEVRAACSLPSGSLAFSPHDVALDLDAPIPRSWQRFVPVESGGQGFWTHDIPETPGLYPIRGPMPAAHLHTVRIAIRQTGRVILGETDGEISPAIFEKMWIWSEPMPGLPNPK